MPSFDNDRMTNVRIPYHRHDKHSPTHGSLAMVALALAGSDRSWRYLDLDGLEVSIVAALGPVLTHSTTLHLTASEVGLTASAYLTGSVLGAIVFSYLTDRQGRKKWFMITLLLYLAATVLTAFSWNLWSFMFFRLLTGAGIGGEYAAINSAIDELIPARTRGHTDLAINGSWWLGSAAGALLTIVLLNPLLIPEYLGWRLCFGFGAVLGVSILLVRRVIPESPRWLMTHGKMKEAEEIVAGIETRILQDEQPTRRCRRLRARSLSMPARMRRSPLLRGSCSPRILVARHWASC